VHPSAPLLDELAGALLVEPAGAVPIAGAVPEEPVLDVVEAEPAGAGPVVTPGAPLLGTLPTADALCEVMLTAGGAVLAAATGGFGLTVAAADAVLAVGALPVGLTLLLAEVIAPWSPELAART
jgi:hypothetical protein